MKQMPQNKMAPGNSHEKSEIEKKSRCTQKNSCRKQSTVVKSPVLHKHELHPRKSCVFQVVVHTNVQLQLQITGNIKTKATILGYLRIRE